MTTVKGFVMAFALMLVVTVTGSASNSVAGFKYQTENLEMSKAVASSASNVSKAKKVHKKAHKKPRGKKVRK